MSGLVTLGLVVGPLLATAGGAVANLVVKEAEGWIDLLPSYLLRLARRRLPGGLRDDLYDEWSAELHEALHDADERPLSRLVLGMRYSAGLVRAGRRIARELEGVRGDGFDHHRYLLPAERPVIVFRRHWSALAGVTVQSAFFVATGAAFTLIDSWPVGAVATWFIIFATMRWLWLVVYWYREVGIFTDQRIIIRWGVLRQRVYAAPLNVVRDPGYERTRTGKLLGYASVHIDADEDEWFKVIDFVPNSETFRASLEALLQERDQASATGSPKVQARERTLPLTSRPAPIREKPASKASD